MTGTTPDRVRQVTYRYGLIALLVALVAYFSLTEPAFGTVRNALVILQSISIVSIVALGVTISLVAGGFDLSVGSTVGFVVMLTATAMVRWNLTGASAVVIGLAAGVAIGLVNGLLIAHFKIPDLLATLGTLFVFQGLALVITSGQSVAAGVTVDGMPAPGSFTEGFLWLGRGRLAGIPIPVLVMGLVTVAVTVFLARTRWGRLLGAVGGNVSAARLAGVRVGRYQVLAYVLSATLASVGGILLSARLGRGDVGAGVPFLLESVAAALIGYAVLGANRPNAIGTVVGAVFVGVLINGLTMKNTPYYAQDLIKGLLLVGALIISFSPTMRRKAAP